MEAAESDQGFALGDSISAADALEEGWLVDPLGLRVPAEGYYIVTPKDRKMSPAAKAFRDWLKGEIAAFSGSAVAPSS